MRLFCKTKDGGSESPVDAYFLFEFKPLGSVCLLKFKEGRREAFHTHAFTALTWFLKGDLVEEKFDGTITPYKRSLLPKVTRKDNNHRVLANKTSWALSIRGPWVDTWTEHNEGTVTTFTHGRVVKSSHKY